jgi:hypothetical protein
MCLELPGALDCAVNGNAWPKPADVARVPGCRRTARRCGRRGRRCGCPRTWPRTSSRTPPASAPLRSCCSDKATASTLSLETEHCPRSPSFRWCVRIRLLVWNKLTGCPLTSQGVPGLRHALPQRAQPAGRRQGAQEAGVLLQHRGVPAAGGPAGAPPSRAHPPWGAAHHLRSSMFASKSSRSLCRVSAAGGLCHWRQGYGISFHCDAADEGEREAAAEAAHVLLLAL